VADVGNVKVHLTGDASGLRRELQGIAPAAREAGIAGAQELGKITTAAGQAGDVIRKQLRGGFEGMSPAALEQIASKMGGVARETENVGKAAGHTHGQVTGLSSGLGTATRHVLGLGMALTGFYGFRSILRAAEDVFLFNSQMEQAQLAVAATVSTSGQLVDAFGKPLPLLQQMNIFLAEGSSAARRLLEDSLRLGIPVEALIHAYSIAAGQAKVAGIEQAKLIPIVEGLVVIADRLQIPRGIMARDLDNIITGLNVQRTLLGIALRLTESQVKEAREQGKLGDLLIEKTKGALAAAEMNLDTWRGVTTAIQNAVRAVATDAGEGAFGTVKYAARDLLDYIKQIRKDPEALRAVRSDLEAITGLALDLTRIAATTIVIAVKFTHNLGNLIGELSSGQGLHDLVSGMMGVPTRGAIQAEGTARDLRGQLQSAAGRVPELVALGQGSNAIDEGPPAEGEAASDAISRLLAVKKQAEAATRIIASLPEWAASDLKELAESVGKAAEAGVGNVAKFQASSGEIAEDIKKGAEILTKGAVVTAQRQLQLAAKVGDVSAYRSAVQTLFTQRQAGIGKQLETEFPQQPGNVDPVQLAIHNKQREDRRKQLQDDSEAQRSTDLERIDSFTQAEQRKTEALRRAIQERASAEIDASRKGLESQKRTNDLNISLAEEQAKYADIFDRRESSRVGRAGDLYELRQKTLALEKQELENVLQAARQRVSEAQTGVFAAVDADPATQGRAASALVKALADADQAGASLEDWNTRAAIALEKHRSEIANLQDDYLHLGDVVKSSLADVVKGLALGTGDWKDAGKRAGQAIMGGMIEATIAKKLAEFDPMIKKNLFDLGTEGGEGAGTNFVSGMLAKLPGIGSLFGGGSTGAAAQSGRMAQVGLSASEISAVQGPGGAFGTGAGGGAMGALGVAGMAYGAASTLATAAGSSSNESMGAGAGAAAGAMIGSIVPVIGTAIGAVIGAVLGFALGSLTNYKPTSETDLAKALVTSFKDIGFTPSLAGVEHGLTTRWPWQDRGTDMPISPEMMALRPEATSAGNAYLFGPGRNLPEPVYVAERTAAALINNAVASRLSAEDAAATFRKFATASMPDFDSFARAAAARRGASIQARGASYETSGFTLADLKRDLPGLTDAELQELFGQIEAPRLTMEELDATFFANIAGALRDFENLPKAIDASRIALEALDEQGNVTMEHLKRVVADSKAFFEQGLSGALREWIQSGDIKDAGKSLADSFASTFTDRFIERLLAGPLSAKLTEAVVDAELAAEAYARGDKAEGDRLLKLARQEYQQGWSDVSRGAGPVVNSVRSILGLGGGINGNGITGYIDQGPLYGFDTGGSGPPYMSTGTMGSSTAIASGTDPVVNVLTQIRDLLQVGGEIIVRMGDTVVNLDSREIARGQQRAETRGRVPGVTLARPVGRRAT